MTSKIYEKADVKKLPDSEVEITVSIPYEKLAIYKQMALAELKENTTIPGFRKGKVPEKMIIEKMGEMGILEEASGLALKDAWREILIDNNLDIVGTPEVSTTKLAPENPFEFSIKASLYPEFELPDYKKIAKTIFTDLKAVIVEDKEIENVIVEIQKIRSAETKKDGSNDESSPEITDDFVKTIGPFKNVSDFKDKIKENLLKEKEFKTKEKNRLEVIAKIIEKSEIPVPSILVEGELDRMFDQFSHDLKRAGTTTSEYLAKIEKDEKTLREEWKKDAKTRVKFELVLDKIAKIENIKAPEEEVEKESKHLIEHHSGAESERVRAYVEHQLKNEAVFSFLEGQK